MIKWEDLSNIVLVGHSYGGYHRLRRGRADRNRQIGSIVFLDAFVPDDAATASRTASSQPVREAIAAAAQKGELALKPVPAAVFRVNEKDRAWVDAHVHAASDRRR